MSQTQPINGKMKMTTINWNSRNFKVICEGQVVFGTACEEWTGWELSDREQYLNNLFGKGNWSWE